MTRGIDVSKWQGNIDFKKVKESGVQFVILRSSSSKNMDTKFLEYAKGFKEAGIPVIGVYHFSYAFDVQGAVDEAKFAISCVQKAGLSKNTFIFFDFEYDTVDTAIKYGVKLGPTQCKAHTKAFCDFVKSQGYKTGVYANVDYTRNWYGLEFLKDYTYWLADWNDPLNYPCVFHQYSATGQVPGINGPVDMNYWYDENQNGSEKPPVEKPAEKKTIDQLAKEVLDGAWGNGPERQKSLTEAGYSYSDVQKKVNELLNAKAPPKKSIDEIAKEVIAGKWGNGTERKQALIKAGYDFNKVQYRVNEIMSGK